MATKQHRPDPEQNPGKPEAADRWPRIAQLPHLKEGAAHIKGTSVTVERLLRELAHEGHLPMPGMIIGKGVREADIVAALLYAADIIGHMTELEALLKSRAPATVRRYVTVCRNCAGGD